MNTSEIGNIGQAAVVNKFIQLGVEVYLPFGEGYTADLIAKWDNKLYKIQIKTTENVLEDSYMDWRTTHQEGYHGNRKKYSNEEVDYFALYCIESKTLCLVPFSEIGDVTVFRVRLDSYSGIRKTGMRFESDYKFENYVK